MNSDLLDLDQVGTVQNNRIRNPENQTDEKQLVTLEDRFYVPVPTVGIS